MHNYHQISDLITWLTIWLEFLFILFLNCKSHFLVNWPMKSFLFKNHPTAIKIQFISREKRGKENTIKEALRFLVFIVYFSMTFFDTPHKSNEQNKILTKLNHTQTFT